MPRPPPDPEPADPLSAAILRAAAGWRTRHDAGGLTPAEEEAFARWLEQDERHAAAFAELGETWSLLDRAREVAPASLGVAPASAARGVVVRRRAGRWLAPIAAAAALVLGLWIWPRPAPTAAEFNEVAVVAPGIVRRLDLPDGSVVRLNSETAVSIRYAARERRVELTRGEGFFEVAKDAARPFVVVARGIDVRAVGTAFSVAHRGGTVEVLVAEGRVSVEESASQRSLLEPPADRARERPAGAAPRVLVAGEKAVIPLEAETPSGPAAISTLPESAVAAALAWQKRLLEFDAAPLATIAAELNRYNRHRIVVVGERLGARQFSGAFQADDPDTLVRLLETRREIVVERKPGETILRER